MTETGASWWLDDDTRWRRGTPPAGWLRGSDGRWRPPSDAQDLTTQELVVVGASWPDPPMTGPPTPTLRSPGARHLTSDGSERRRPAKHRSGDLSSLPLRTKLAVPALVAAIAVVIVGGVLTLTGDARRTAAPAGDVVGPGARSDLTPPTTGSAPSPTAPAEEAAPATDASPGPPVAGPTTTTTLSSPTTPTTSATPTAPSDPLAACSTAQRNVIERGNHPWEWYVARFDEDGDGILCT